MRTPFRSFVALMVVCAGVAACTGGSGGNGTPTPTATPSPTPTPNPNLLQNDGFVSGGTVAYNSGFVIGEAAATVLGPRTTGFTVEKITLVFGGMAATQAVTLTIYADSGLDNPGAVLYTADYSLTASDGAMQEIDLTAENIALPANEKFRVSVAFQHDGLPTVARDTDGITPARNYIFAVPGGWSKAETLGVTGDWIIRAEILPIAVLD